MNDPRERCDMYPECLCGYSCTRDELTGDTSEPFPDGWDAEDRYVERHEADDE